MDQRTDSCNKHPRGSISTWKFALQITLNLTCSFAVDREFFGQVKTKHETIEVQEYGKQRRYILDPKYHKWDLVHEKEDLCSRASINLRSRKRSRRLGSGRTCPFPKEKGAYFRVFAACSRASYEYPFLPTSHIMLSLLKPCLILKDKKEILPSLLHCSSSLRDWWNSETGEEHQLLLLLRDQLQIQVNLPDHSVV